MSFYRGSGRGGDFRGGRRGQSAGPEPQLYTPSSGRVPPINAVVTKAEDGMLDSAEDIANKTKLLKIEDKFPMRPGFGTRGIPVTLWANYVEMSTPKDLVLYSYSIEVQPTAAGRKLNQIVRLLLQVAPLSNSRADIVSDFTSTLISRKNFSQEEIQVSVTYRGEGEDEPVTGATVYTVTVKPTQTLSMSALFEYLNGSNVTNGDAVKLPLIQALNIMVRHYSRENGSLATIGSSKSFSIGRGAERWNLDQNLEALRGFFSSVRAATGRILVNVNVSNAAFYRAGPLDVVVRHYHSSLVDLNKFLKRLRVQTTHLPAQKNKRGEKIARLRTIFSLATPQDGQGFQNRPRVSKFGAGSRGVSFWLANTPAVPTKKDGDGQYITVNEFFKQQHNIRLKCPDLSVVNVGTAEKPVYLPPEVCIVVEGQAAKTRLSPVQTQQMIRFAVRTPGENAQSIAGTGLKAIGLDTNINPRLRQFGISVGSDMITVQGRLLPTPKVLYNNKKEQPRVSFGSWNLEPIKGSRGRTVVVKLNRGGQLPEGRWSYVMLNVSGQRSAFRSPETLGNKFAEFANVLRSLGMRVETAIEGERESDIQSPGDPKLEELIRLSATKGLKLLFLVLPSEDSALYNRIKQLGDVKYGVATVCIVGSKFAKAENIQYMANVALKVNLKMGGCNHVLDDSRLPLLRQNKTMIVGIDVTHPSPGSSSSAPSIAGMVANVDSTLGQWPAALKIQHQARREMVDELESMMTSRLKLWKTKGNHGEYPENILVFRDGVSEGQYHLVLEQELPLLRKACRNVYPPAEQKKGLPHFTVIIVGKRHHTRFYPTTPNGDRNLNTLAGTVVDRGITEAPIWDFYLQSHAAIKGTARPAHYVVVKDEIFSCKMVKLELPNRNAADLVEEMAQAMCYTYGRATKAVSLCTPAYYADILCERARCYLSNLYDGQEDDSKKSDAGGKNTKQGGTAPDPALQTLLQIHEGLKDTMFYI
ncbi:hypothetical protein S7711_03401 [Stachybotrys chartarum IBT 7711]|uniref:Piwi domain-containing protein n=1 Tax=Stachybotrys chartarum (strain CBS 109288 / IBT 7711) TaxID=1280523 RepID=A0A084AY01_STACB|nr:hypothetical protein S7711_03401 [Stachybotrys chartarum IBT 7711]